MLKELKKPTTIIGLICAIIFTIIFKNDDYMIFKNHKCVVVDKSQSTGNFIHKGKLYLILQEETGIIFDLIVSPAVYSQTKKGDIKYFSLRRMDIKQTMKDNIIFFFGQVIFGVIGITFILLSLCALIKNTFKLTI